MNSHRQSALGPPMLMTADPYRDNAFRLSGLPVDATPRQVRRRLGELEAARRLRSEVPSPTRIRPVTPHPGPDAVIEALTRLRDPVRRLWDELLWLWPSPGDGHDDDTLPQARDRWRELSSGSPEARCVALHNVAVVDHIAAIEGDPSNRDRRPADWETARRQRTKAAGKWRSVYRHWRELVSDEQCRARLESRVDEIGDPRLRSDAVDTILDRLPELVLRTHAAVAVAVAPSDHHFAARHADLMRGSGFDAAIVDRVLVEACEPHVDRLRGLCRDSRDHVADPDAWARAAERLDEETRRGLDLRVPRALLGADHRVTSGIQDELAASTRRCVVAEANDTIQDNSEKRLERLRLGIERLSRARHLATAPYVRQQIGADTATLLSNLVIGTIDIALTAADTDPERGLSEQAELLERTAEALNRLEDLDPQTAETLRAEVGFAGHQLLVVYVNETCDAAAAVEPMRDMLHTATDTRLRAKLTKSIQDLRLLDRALPPPRYAPRPVSRSASRREPETTHPDGWCLFCGLNTGQARTVVLKRFRVNTEDVYEYREHTVACCAECGYRPLRHGFGSLLFGVAGAIALSLIVALNLGPDWRWGLMWIPIWLLGLPALLAWKVILRVHRDRLRLRDHPRVGPALSGDWRYHSG